jgi:xanthine dehydrogenase accessory factor
VKAEILARLVADRAAKRPVALATELGSGAQILIYDHDIVGDLPVASEEISAIRAALRDDAGGMVGTGGRQLFVQIHNPPPRLLIVGAVHIAQVLAPMAALAGYGVAVIDPRRAFASDRRFPDLALSTAWPDEALAELKPDRRTAVVTLTHDPKLDDPALESALRSEAFYLGALGSRKTHAARLARLRARGFDDAALARIHGPVGLAIGAESPAEIALSIMAEITAVRRQATGADRSGGARNRAA